MHYTKLFSTGLTSWFADLQSLIERGVAAAGGRAAVLAAHRLHSYKLF